MLALELGKFAWEVEEQMSYREYVNWCTFYAQREDKSTEPEVATPENIMEQFI